MLYGLRGIELADAALKKVLPPTLTLQPHLLGIVRTVLVVSLVSTGLYRVSVLAEQNLHPDQSSFTNASTVQVSRWIIDNPRPTDVIIDDQDAIVHRLTGRRTFHLPLSTDPFVLRDTVIANKVAFIVIPKRDSMGALRAAPAQTI